MRITWGRKGFKPIGFEMEMSSTWAVESLGEIRTGGETEMCLSPEQAALAAWVNTHEQRS